MQWFGSFVLLQQRSGKKTHKDTDNFFCTEGES
jgi:hypothetical protein